MDVGEPQRICTFCLRRCEESATTTITSVQARALSTVLSLEGQTSPLPSKETEVKYLHATPCTSCQEYLTEAESVVEEWELVLHRMRTIGSRLLQIIRESKKRAGNTKKPMHLHCIKSEYHFQPSPDFLIIPQLDYTNEFEEQILPDIPGTPEHFLPPDESENDRDDSSLAGSEGDEGHDRTKQRAVKRKHDDDDPEWVPDETSAGPSCDSLTALRSLTPRFTRVQKVVLFQQYENNKVILESTRYDDEDPAVSQIWNEVATAVSNAEPNSIPNLKLCWKTLQPKIFQERQEKSNTFTYETVGGPVLLKFAKIQLIRCDHHSFQPNDRRSKRKCSAIKSKAKKLDSHYLAMIERFRKKALANSNLSSDLGNKGTKMRAPPSSRYKAPEGIPEFCFAPRCKFSSTDPDRLAGHYRRKHLKDPYPYKCSEPTCNKQYAAFHALHSHRNRHKGLFYFSCHLCSKGFDRQGKLNEHILRRHTTNPVLHCCSICNRSFRIERDLKYHVKDCHSQPSRKCTVAGCSFGCAGKAKLWYHQSRVHPDLYPNLLKPKSPQEREVCAECGKTFGSKANFRRHQLQHEGVSVEVLKPHTCPHEGCNYRSEAKAYLKKHIECVHETTEKRFKCTVPGCSRMFKHQNTIKVHIQRVHTPKNEREPKKRWTCALCGLKLSSPKTLEDHIAIKHTEGNKNDFSCSRCKRGFPTKKYLRRHEIKYPNCKPIKIGPDSIFCELCEKYCSNLAGFKRHNHLVHNSELRPWDCERCGKTFPIKMYLMRHQRESKSCLPLQSDSQNTVSYPTEPGGNESFQTTSNYVEVYADEKVLNFF